MNISLTQLCQNKEPVTVCVGGSRAEGRTDAGRTYGHVCKNTGELQTAAEERRDAEHKELHKENTGRYNDCTEICTLHIR